MQDRTFNCWSRHHSSYTSQHTPLIIHHSSYTTHHTPLNIHHSSFITCHTPLIIQDSSYIVSEFKTDFTFKFGFHSVRCGPHPWQVVVAGCVSSLAGGTHTPYTRGIPWVKSPERVRLTGGRACWRERGHSYRSISSYRKLPPPACPGTTCSARQVCDSPVKVGDPPSDMLRTKPQVACSPVCMSI